MSKTVVKLFSVLIVSATLFLVSSDKTFASTLHLSPGSGTVGQGNTLSVRVTLNTGGEGVNGVSAYLSYSSDKIDASVSCGGAFAIGAECSAGGGSIRISRGSINPVSGNVTVGTITLKGKVQGTASVSFVGGSAAPRASDSSDSLNLGGSSGGTYTVGPPQATSASPAQPQQTAQTQTSPDTQAPQLLDIAVSDIATNSATIAWKTNEPADSSVEFGLDQDGYFLSSLDAQPTTEHTLKLESRLFIAGGFYHFRVVSKDAVGNIGSSTDLTFQLKGYRLIIKVTDSKGMPLKNTEVILYTEPQRATTDSNGTAIFDDVSPGRHLVVFKLKDDLSQTQNIDIAEDLPVQEFEVTVESVSDERVAWLYSVVAIMGLALVGGVIVFFIKKRRGNITAQ